jgi:hypothetical protein
VSVTVGDSSTTVEGTITRDESRSWEDFTEAQIKEKTTKAYQDAIKSVLSSRKSVTPR